MTCDELVADPALEGVSEELALLVRVFGVPQEEILVRVIEAGVDSVLSDPEVSDIVNRLHRLDARRGKRTSKGEVEVAPKPDVVAPTAVRKPEPEAQEDEPVVNFAPVNEEERRKAASFVREVRMALGLTQAELGEKLGISGGYVSLIERADRAVGSNAVRNAVAWARANRIAA